MKMKKSIFSIAASLIIFMVIYSYIKEDDFQKFRKVFKPKNIQRSSCEIPEFPPWNTFVKQYIGVPENLPYTCKEKPPLIRRVNSTHLDFDLKAAVQYYNVKNELGVSCVACQITRLKTATNTNPYYLDNNYRLSRNCSSFNMKEDIPFPHTLVKCFYEEREIYRNIYMAFPVSKQRRLELTNRTDALSVLIIALDALSKHHFRRAFPQTAKFIDENEFIQFNKFMKVGDNTLPNFLATVTGNSDESCSTKGLTYRTYDNCNIIWEEFKKSGYLTAYYEDKYEWQTFNSKGGGFVNQPTEFYSRPAFIAINDQLEKTRHNSCDLLCHGDRFDSEILIDTLKNFATSRAKQLPYFGIFWGNGFTHDILESAFVGDHYYISVFKDLFSNEDILNKTIVFFISDHGITHGTAYLETYPGYLEQRLPLFTMWLPTWFKKQYPKTVNNLQLNRNHVTSPFDTYKTLKGILHSEFTGSVTTDNGFGESFFGELPENRDCKDAGIPEEFCVCMESEDISIDLNIVKRTVAACLQYIQKILHGKIGVLCDNIKLDKVLSARKIHRKRDNVTSEYIVTFRTLPGPAVFQGTVRRSVNESSDNLSVLGQVGRINRYGNQSYCVSEHIDRLYCHCK